MIPQTVYTIRFPNESEEYRKARNELLAEEVELRDMLEQTAELRQKLPPGGSIPEDYIFEEYNWATQQIQEVRLSELFGTQLQSLVVISMIFNFESETPCTCCSSTAEAISPVAEQLKDITAVVFVTKAPAEKIAHWRQAHPEHWGYHLHVLSSANNNFNKDYYGEYEGKQLSILNVFEKRNVGDARQYMTQILHVYATEYAPKNDRDEVNSYFFTLIWPIFGIMDLSRQSKPWTNFNFWPQLEYENKQQQ